MALAPQYGLGDYLPGLSGQVAPGPFHYEGPVYTYNTAHPVDPASLGIPAGAPWIPGTVQLVNQGGYQCPRNMGGYPALDTNGMAVGYNSQWQLVYLPDPYQPLAPAQVAARGAYQAPAPSSAGAPSELAMEDPDSPYFQQDYTDSSGNLHQFDSQAARSVWWWQSHGYSASAALTKAQTAAAKLGLPVIPISGGEVSSGTYVAPPTTTPPDGNTVDTRYTTPPGTKLPINSPPTTPPTDTGQPLAAGFGGWTALLLGGGLLLAMTRGKKR